MIAASVLVAVREGNRGWSRRLVPAFVPLLVPAFVLALVLGLTVALGIASVPDGGAPLGTGPAAGAVSAETSGEAAAATVPAAFRAVVGYAPVRLRMADGTARMAKPSGSCSSPLGGAPFDFTWACRAHDYGYDLLRYATATGRPLEPAARRNVDAMLAHDLRARCAVAGGPLTRVACRSLADVYLAVVGFNSWRQGYGNPGPEPWLPWTAGGLVLLAIGGPLACAIRGRRGRVRARLAAGAGRIAAATPAGRDRYVDFLRVASILVVVAGHWLMVSVVRTPDGLRGGNALTVLPSLRPVTWVLQVMPVFFFVGGYANLRSWQAAQRRGGGYAGYLRGRMARLLRPVVVLVAGWLLALPLLRAAGVPEVQVRMAGRLVAQPLWFLGVYLAVVALAPALAYVHARRPVAVLVTLGAGVGAVDVARLWSGSSAAGYPNLLLVWLCVHQLGFAYADGTLTRLPRRALYGLAAAGLGALVALTTAGPYPVSMVGLPGERMSNMSPPTVCVLALAGWQVALVLLARRRVSTWLDRPGAWAAVVTVGGAAMTLYLWHLTALIILAGAALAAGVDLPAAGTVAWWVSRPLWLGCLLLTLAPVVAALSRLERPARVHRAAARPVGGAVAAVAGVVCAVLGMLGFAAGGLAGGRDRTLAGVVARSPLLNVAYLLAAVAACSARGDDGPLLRRVSPRTPARTRPPAGASGSTPAQTAARALTSTRPLG